MTSNHPTILVIFGATGDLAHRYLLPAIKQMKTDKILPEKFEMILASRSDYSTLKYRIDESDKKMGSGAQKLFHLAVPEKAQKEVLDFIALSNLADSHTKIMLEKPFGRDLESAKKLVDHVAKYFKEDQVYRVDHYLARETAQDFIKKRLTDKNFEEKLNKNFVSSIEVIASEKIDIEGRANFYEQTGALRDFVQSHLLELLALVLMKIPDGGEGIHTLREAALWDLGIVCDVTKNECVARGQYEGYKEEVKNPISKTETFVSVNLVSNDSRWQGVPITLSTGKAMREKYTRIFLTFKNGEKMAFDFATRNGKAVNGYVEVYKKAFAGESDYFTWSAEVLESWRILDAIQKTWEVAKDDLIIYPKGANIEDIIHLYAARQSRSS